MNFSSKEEEKELPFIIYVFEFHQGSQPVILYHNGKNVQNEDKLLWYVVTTPAAQDSNLINQHTSIFYSTFDNFHIAAFYLLIPDIQARGFTRTVSICICSELDFQMCIINNSIDKKISQYFEESVHNHFSNFLEKMSQYVGGLEATIKEDSKHADLLQQIKIEIMPIIKSLSIEPDLTQQSRNVKEFTEINNDLRDVTELFDFKLLINNIEQLLTKELFPKTTNMYKAKYDEQFPYLDFGGINGEKYPIFVKEIFDHSEEINKQKHKMLYLMKTKIFHHCIYTLLTGKTLVIESSSYESVELLAKHFTLFVPFFNDDDLYISKEPVIASDIRQYSIVIAPSIERNSPQFVSILNTNLGYYEGTICPSTSIIYREFNFKVTTETSLLLLSFNRLKSIGNLFISIMHSWFLNVPNSKDKMKKEMREEFHLSDADESLFAFWINCVIRGQQKRVVLLSNPALAGVGIVTYSLHS